MTDFLFQTQGGAKAQWAFSPDSVLICHSNGRILENNPIAQNKLFFKKGTNILDYVKEKELMMQYLSLDLAEIQNISFETLLEW